MGAPGPRLTPADALRLAVRADLQAVLSGLPGTRDPLVLVAVSGGPDSLALLCGTVAVAPALAVRVGAVTVDHGWHEGSAAVAADVARVAAVLGCRPVTVRRVDAAAAGGGPEAAARTARYAALDDVAHDVSAAAVLLGHTMDDQAETVLVGLARGSGGRSLSGMAAVRGRYRRPLLGLRRPVVHEALPVLARSLDADLGGLPWRDPANADPAYLRARVRELALPAVEAALGPGSVEALARSADLLRADADALDGWAARVVAPGGPAAPSAQGVPVAALADLPPAVLTRVLRLLAADAGAGPLSAAMTASLVALVTARSGSGAGPVALPGGVSARRAAGRLGFEPTATRGRLLPGPAAGGATAAI